jgi:hypothetical protein
LPDWHYQQYKKPSKNWALRITKNANRFYSIFWI